MDIARLIAGLLLPWILGTVWMRARWLMPKAANWPTILGYGYFFGAIATVAIVHLLDATGVRLSFASIAATEVVFIAAGFFFWHGEAWSWPDWGADWRLLTGGLQRAAFCILLALIVIRLAGLGLEIVYRPLYPWDAWSQWATKARVWFELGRLTPFVSHGKWLSNAVPGAYTDFAPHYPSAIPILQMWASLCLGRWDDALMNLSWIQCAVALGLAFYGQARHWAIPCVGSMLFSYFLLSLPLLDSHVALAGYADLFMAAYLGLAAMAFFVWVRTRERWHGAMALFFAVSCIFIKQPGTIWMLTFVPALWVRISPRTAWIGILALIGVGAAALIAPHFVGPIEMFGYVFQGLHYASGWGALLQSLFVLDNWHLLWYFALAALLFSLPRLFADAFRVFTTLIMTACLFLIAAFFFTSASAWMEDFTTVNRAFLHMAPMLLFYVMVLVREAFKLPAWVGLSPDPLTEDSHA